MRTGEAAACARVILEQTFVVCALMRTLDDSNILCQLSGSSILAITSPVGASLLYTAKA